LQGSIPSGFRIAVMSVSCHVGDSELSIPAYWEKIYLNFIKRILIILKNIF
jgi:hypothetical protein